MDLSKLQYTPRKLMLNQCKAGDVITAELWNSVLGFFVQNTNSIQDVLSAHGEAFATMYNTFTVVLDDVREMQYKTEQAKASLENGTLWIFDGGNAEGAIDLDGDNTPETNVADVKIVIDGEMSDNSSNMVKNKAIKKYVDTAVSTGVQNLKTSFNATIAAVEEETQNYVNEQVKEVSENVAAFKGSVADYIVEQGTSGIWTYRKWASGIAECWGRERVITPYGPDNTMALVVVDLPFAFVPYPTINCSGHQQELYESYIAMVSPGETSVAAWMKCERPVDNRYSCWFSFDIKGVWNKEVHYE